MAEEIIMKVAEKQELLKCPLTGKLFETEPGKPVFTLNNHPVSPDHAQQVGFKIDPLFKLPDTVTSKGKLNDYLGTLGLKRDSSQYLELWKRFSEPLPFKRNEY